jgi:hypothetical protein
MTMTIAELLPTVRSLSRIDKLQLIQWLAADLAQADAEELCPIVPAQTYPLWSPDRAYDAAATLLQVLDEEEKTRT